MLSIRGGSLEEYLKSVITNNNTNTCPTYQQCNFEAAEAQIKSQLTTSSQCRNNCDRINSPQQNAAQLNHCLSGRNRRSGIYFHYR